MTREIVIRVLRDSKAAGTTMIGVFHDLDVMGRLVDRVFSIEAGRSSTKGSAAARRNDLTRVPGHHEIPLLSSAARAPVLPGVEAGMDLGYSMKHSLLITNGQVVLPDR